MNNETKWEQDFQMKYCGELYKQEVSEDFRGFRGCYQEVKDFISQEIEKAYQKGKEDKIFVLTENEYTNRIRLQTLEEVERGITGHYYKETELNDFFDKAIKTINKMKTK